MQTLEEVLIMRSELRPMSQSTSQGSSGSGWAIAGLALVALGIFGWYSFGPDLRRYIKISNM
jgi:hypothetical protein